jgi:hypothetical protein
MNVIQISGDSSNPNIWQFFVVSIGVNLLIILTLSLTHAIGTRVSNENSPGFKEALCFAIGR